jgi:SEC-C motif
VEILVEFNRAAPCPCGSGKTYETCCLAGVGGEPPGGGSADPVEWSKTSRGLEQDNQIDRYIIQGHRHLDQQDFPAACEIWSRVWDQFLLRLSPRMTSCEKSLPEYDGSFYLADWLQDYCAALHSLALSDNSQAQSGVSFCRQVLLQFPDETSLWLENFRASLGEFHFVAGNPVEGEKVLTELIADFPHRSVGYAHLSDMLGTAKYNVGQDQPLDLPAAINLLERGLAYPVEDAPDHDLEGRLGRLREALGS